MRRTRTCTQHQIDPQPGQSYRISRVNGERRGAIHPNGASPVNCRVEVSQGMVLTLKGIPRHLRDSLGLQAVEVVRYIGAGHGHKKRARDLVELQSGRQLSLATFAFEGVSVCVGIADFLQALQTWS